MAGDNGSRFDPDAFAKALEPLFQGVTENITVEMGGVRTEVRALRMDVQQVGAEVGGLRTQVGEVRTGLDSLRARVDVLPTAIAAAVAPQLVDLRTHLDRNLAVRAEQDATINFRLDKLEERVGALEKKD